MSFLNNKKSLIIWTVVSLVLSIFLTLFLLWYGIMSSYPATGVVRSFLFGYLLEACTIISFLSFIFLIIKTLKVNRMAAVIIFLLLVVVIAVFYLLFLFPKRLTSSAGTNTINQTTVMPAPSDEVVMDNSTVFGLKDKQPGTKLYYSQKLGIGFTYLQDPVSPVTVTETGNKIYVHGSKRSPDQGQSLEVFTKNPSLSLQEAIGAKFLNGYSPKDCFVKIDEPNAIGLPNYIATVISFPRSEDQNAPWWQNSKCPENYSETNGQQYFLMNKDVPDRFLFVRIGQYSEASDGMPVTGTPPAGQNWSHSIRILPIVQ